MKCSRQRYIVLIRPEVASITEVCHFGSGGAATRRGDIDDSRQGVCAVQDAIASAKDLDVSNSCRRDVGEFQRSADVVHGNATQKNFMECARGERTAADRNGTRAAPPSGLQYLNSRHGAESF